MPTSLRLGQASCARSKIERNDEIAKGLNAVGVSARATKDGLVITAGTEDLRRFADILISGLAVES